MITSKIHRTTNTTLLCCFLCFSCFSYFLCACDDAPRTQHTHSTIALPKWPIQESPVFIIEPQEQAQEQIQEQTARDPRTGLQWALDFADIQTQIQTQTQTQAQEHCANLVFAGFTDWRLPTLAEATTLLDYTQPQAPYSTLPHLARIPQISFWTDTTSPQGGAFFRIDFATGAIQTVAPDGLNSAAICVRGVVVVDVPQYTLYPHREGDVVEDLFTGLVWEKSTDRIEFYNHEQAAAHCAALDAGGLLGWRIPTLKELRSIVDPNQRNPTYNPDAFPDEFIRTYWSDTPSPPLPDSLPTDPHFWLVDFFLGEQRSEVASIPIFVRCVHSGF